MTDYSERLPSETSEPTAPGDDVKFTYIKSNQFRVIHVDGAAGGINPDGNLTIALWNQRPAIPREIWHKSEAGGKLGPEITSRRQTAGGVVREVETSLTLDIRTAVSLFIWLRDRIKEAEALGIVHFDDDTLGGGASADVRQE